MSFNVENSPAFAGLLYLVSEKQFIKHCKFFFINCFYILLGLHYF